MASGKIKGITIEFRGDTTKLERAIKDVNKEIDPLDKELKNINKALRFNPDNVELLAQKQEVLTDRIKETTEKLDLLKQAKEKADKDDSIEKNSAEYRELSRQIIVTDSKLSNFEDQLTDTNTKLERASLGVDDLDDEMEQLEKQTKETNDGFTTMRATIANLIANGINKLVSAIDNQLDAAVSRVDTIHAYERTMKALGYTEEEVAKATDELTSGIQGLPTTLPEVVSMQQQYAALTGDIDKATELTLALNDATLASGKGQEEASRAADAWYKIMAKGTPEMEQWTTLNEIMPAQMNQIAESMLGTGKKSSDLYKAWQEGTVTTEDVMSALIELDKKGGKSIASFEKQAHDASAGISTTMANIKVAITNAIAAIIETIGYDNIVKALERIKEAIKSAGKAFLDVVKWVKSNGTAITTVIAAITAALTALFIVGGGFKALTASVLAWAAASKVAAAAQWLVNAAMNANPISLMIVALAGLVAAIVVLWNKSEKFRDFWIALWDKIKEKVTAFKTGFNEAKNAVVSQINALKDKATELKDKFIDAKDKIINGFKSIPDKFKEVWNSIGTGLKNLGSKVGTAVLSAIKGGINGVISTVENVINKAIDKINAAITWANKVIPGSKHDIGSVSHVSLPRLARGGIVDSATLALIGEGSSSEAVVPLDEMWKKMAKMINGGGEVINITVNGAAGQSVEELAAAVERRLINAQKRRTQAWA